MQPEVYLLRHPALEMEGVCYGQTDVLPSRKGMASIPEIARQAVAIQPRVIISSDLARCKILAHAIADRTGLPVWTTPRLREISVGEWENRSWAEIESSDPLRFRAWLENYLNEIPPGGETGQELQNRAVDCVRDALQNHSGRLLLVTHSGVIRVLRCFAMGYSLDRNHEMRVGYGELTRLEPLEKFYSVPIVHPALSLTMPRVFAAPRPAVAA
jgi:broad specificity phosphatase PhoE